jgi:hypothetical protein
MVKKTRLITFNPYALLSSLLCRRGDNEEWKKDRESNTDRTDHEKKVNAEQKQTRRTRVVLGSEVQVRLFFTRQEFLLPFGVFPLILYIYSIRLAFVVIKKDYSLSFSAPMVMMCIHQTTDMQ